METLAGACRAVACAPRLRLLRRLARASELTVGELVKRTGVPEALVSAHLRVVAAAGLVERRRSGAKVYYRLAPEPVGTGLFVPTRLLHRAFTEPGWALKGWDCDGLVHLSAADVPRIRGNAARALDVVFDAATAFTNVRRLRVVSLLRQMGLSSEEGIRADLKMSHAACYRHLYKLQRRGYVRQKARGVWALAARHRTPVHGALFSLVIHRLAVLG